MSFQIEGLLERLMLKIYGLATACVSMFAFAASAFAQAQPVRVGGLTCIAAPRIGLVLGSRQNLRCVFRRMRLEDTTATRAR